MARAQVQLRPPWWALVCLGTRRPDVTTQGLLPTELPGQPQRNPDPKESHVDWQRRTFKDVFI